MTRIGKSLLILALAVTALGVTVVGLDFGLGIRCPVESLTRLQAEALAKKLERYRAAESRYPSQDEGLASLVPKYASAAELVDHWQRPFLYEIPGGRNPGSFDVYSYGADGVPGGSKENTDVGNWSDPPSSSERSHS